VVLAALSFVDAGDEALRDAEAVLDLVGRAARRRSTGARYRTERRSACRRPVTGRGALG
jgi:hypothetical protein